MTLRKRKIRTCLDSLYLLISSVNHFSVCPACPHAGRKQFLSQLCRHTEEKVAHDQSHSQQFLSKTLCRRPHNFFSRDPPSCLFILEMECVCFFAGNKSNSWLSFRSSHVVQNMQILKNSACALSPELLLCLRGWGAGLS